MHPSDGNTYAINKHLAEIEAHEAAQPPDDMYCGTCNEVIRGKDWPEFIDTETCPNCDGNLCQSETDYEPSEAAQGLIPIPDRYNEA
ncbi:MAG: hypothetical protein WA790_02550 [Sulfitobacter sp.]